MLENSDLIINNFVLNYILIFLLFEFFEISWQKAPSLMGMLLRMHKYYSKSIFIFLLMHPTLYFVIGFAVLNDYSFVSVLIMTLKLGDIATKIYLLHQVFVKREITQELSLILLAPLNSFLPYLGLIVYPVLIYLNF